MLGTPIICTVCGTEERIRLKRGVKIKSVCCSGCGGRATMMRNTEWDKTVRAKESKEPST